jgi:hypothetical protein
MTPHPWDDLEQRFLRFTIAVKDMAESACVAVDQETVPATTIDAVQNILTGLIEYVKVCEDEIAEAMEGKIRHDYKSQGYRQTNFYTEINDDWTIDLPGIVVSGLGWKSGDLLTWTVLNDKEFMVRKVDQ